MFLALAEEAVKRNRFFNMLFLLLRWLVLIALCFFGYKKKSLTTWIFISMLVGAEVGYDFPYFAINLKVISTAFLKLIKTIIAPLLFGTLVVGIAGHSNIKQVVAAMHRYCF